MSKVELKILATGVANLASVQAAWRRLNVDPEIVRSAEAIAAADFLIVPGVGTFQAAMDGLNQEGACESLRERIQAGRPTLAICLGLQLLAATSQESPVATGLGIFSVPVCRFSAPRVPQMGWNRVEAAADSRFISMGFAYYANSYALIEQPDGWIASWSNYHGRYVAALERGSVLACQFHPELSGAWGSQLLQRWLETARC